MTEIPNETFTLSSFLIGSIPNAILIGLIAFFGKKHLKSLEDEARLASESVKTIGHDYSLKLFDLSEKVHGNLETMLTKFSAWEDRVKAIIQEDKNLTPETKKHFHELTKETKKELFIVKEDIQRVSSEVNEVVESMRTLKFSSKNSDHNKCEMKDHITDLEHKISSIQLSTTEKLNYNEELMKKLLNIQKKLNEDVKTCEKSINTLAKTKGGIRLFDYADNNKG